MFDATLKNAVSKAVSDSCKSEYVTKEELESVLYKSLQKLFSDRDFKRLINEIVKEYDKK